MATEHRAAQSDYLSSLAELLGLSISRLRRKLRWGRLLIVLSPKADQEVDQPRSANIEIVRALQDRVRSLEDRLDKTEAERRQLIQDAEAERTMLLQAIIEAQRSNWPGLWPWLKGIWLGDTATQSARD